MSNIVGANCGSPDCLVANRSSPENTSTQDKQTQSKPNRKNIRLKGYDYSLIGAYFITICCHEKQHLFGRIRGGETHLNSYGRIVQDEWLRTQTMRKNIVLDAYVIMPNHFHGILIIHNDIIGSRLEGEPQFATRQSGEPRFAPTVGDVMKGFKQAVTMRMRAIGFEGKVWQRGYYDHIIRNIHDYETTVEYILSNPSRWTVGANCGSPEVSG